MSRALTKKKYGLEFVAESLLPDDRLAKPQNLLAHLDKEERALSGHLLYRSFVWRI